MYKILMFFIVIMFPFSGGAVQIDLSEKGITDDSVAAAITAPRPVAIGEVFKKFGSDHMLDKLKVINLASNEISDEGAQVVCDSLRKMPNMEFIDLSYNRIKQEGIMKFIPLIIEMENLKVNLTQNYADVTAISYFYDNLRAEAEKQSKDFEACSNRAIFFDEGILSHEGTVRKLREKLANHASENWLRTHQNFYQQSTIAH
ncbi:MAG: hypothetical protein HOL16_08355 [Alphaproteobacteria bacterium]|nr:hypothetical protein [Alphaproteobacteria bacterium]